MAIRTATSLDQIPNVEPKRYLNAFGYWRLRWRIGKGEYVEAYEHRYLMGLPGPGFHVHHLNHDRQDNRPENLRVMTRAEHVRHHGDDKMADDQAVIQLYQQGLSMPEVGRRLGLNAGTVSRILKRNGIKARTNAGHYEHNIDRDQLLQRAFAGDPMAAIARDMGIRPGTARRMAKEAGWQGKPGRPRRTLDRG